MMRLLKRFLVVGVILLVLIGVGVGLTIWRLGQAGTSPLERWIGNQLQSVASGYLNPTLAFKDLDYQYPSTVVLTDVRLTAADPAGAGKTVDVLAVKKLTLTLAEIPREGQPFRIQKIILDHPELRVVQSGPPGADNRHILGFGDLIKKGPADTATTTQPGERVPLSSVFEIRHIELIDGLLVYDNRTPGTEPMKLDQINSKMEVQPAKEAGFYALDMAMKRDPVFSTLIKGGVNLDTMTLALENLEFKLKMGREQDHYLPPELQETVKAHDVTGDLACKVKGTLPLSDWRTAALDADLTLTNGNYAMGENKLPIEKLEANYTMADRVGKLTKLDTNLLGGRLDATATITLNDALDAALDATITKAQIEQSLKTQGRYKGLVDGVIHWRGPLTDPMKKSGGDGKMNITRGRIAKLPVLGDIFGSLQEVMKITGVDKTSEENDTAQAVWTFQGDKLNFSQLDAQTQWASLTGTGTIGYDSKLDLTFHGGPLEKVTGGLLPKQVGGLLSKGTGALAAYRVTGTTSEPKVGVNVAGIGK